MVDVAHDGDHWRALLERLFLDNLPFALDVLESAADPARYTSPTTGLRAERLAQLVQVTDQIGRCQVG